MKKISEMQVFVNLLTAPAFSVRSGKISCVNEPAQRMLFSPGIPIETLLLTGEEELNELKSGCLCLQLQYNGCVMDATVSRFSSETVFLLEPQEDAEELRVLALAALELSKPLSDLTLSVGHLDSSENNAQLRKNLARVQRIVSNMSDAYGALRSPKPETRNITVWLRELFEKAETFAAEAGFQLEYYGLPENLYMLTDCAALERAIWNLLSNAMKFSPKGTRITAACFRFGQMLQLRIQDQGIGIADSLRNTLFTRFHREPGIEDYRHGLGLGMVMVRKAAAAHHGAVLVDTPEEGGTRITLTLQIRQQTNYLRSPQLMPDYAGGRDHVRQELSDVLPPEQYR